MPDASYQPKVYRDKGGDRMVIASGGELELNGVDLVTTGGQVDFSAQGQGYKRYVESLSSSAASITAYGITKIQAATALTMPLGAPSAGVEKWITAVTTAATMTITSSSAGADMTTAGSTQISITTGTLAAPSWVHLLGLNSTRWTVLGQSANVTVS